MQNVKILNRSRNPLPAYQTPGSAGMDLCAANETSITLKTLERVLIPTGIFLEIPTGFEAQIRPRSGLAFKQGLTLPNSPATIDSDYRGELKVALVNLGSEPVEIEYGMRIAQLVIAPVTRVQWQPVEEISTTMRNDNGFGSTGV